jgi:hypothetical protein
MSEHRDPSESSSGAKQVSFSDLVFIIGPPEDAYDEGLPRLQEILHESDSTLSFSEIQLAKSDKFMDCNEYSTYSGNYDFGEGLQSYPNLSFDDTSISEESLPNDENGVETVREYPDASGLATARHSSDEESHDPFDKPESGGWASNLFSSIWYLSMIASLSGMLGWLTSCLCSHQSVPVDHDDAAAAGALTGTANKGFIITSFTGDGGTTFIT